MAKKPQLKFSRSEALESALAQRVRDKCLVQIVWEPDASAPGENKPVDPQLGARVMNPTCMAEGEDSGCSNEATRFTALGPVLLCFCDEHRGRLIDGERPIDKEEWLARAAMELVHDS